MSKEAEFTVKLEPELREEFMAEAEADHRTASQVVRELMREYVQRQRHAREYEDFLTAKVNVSRRSLQAGEGIDHADVKAEFTRHFDSPT
ncbi:CopG family ribbon-helix-helix protein [Citricoccus parietis]|uniref:CopG family ribbon-helix-helix protein n=2 Tax=Citricoccus parietis TaxID=592307 RepID=A0ABV5G2M3_9MICC